MSLPCDCFAEQLEIMYGKPALQTSLRWACRLWIALDRATMDGQVIYERLTNNVWGQESLHKGERQVWRCRTAHKSITGLVLAQYLQRVCSKLASCRLHLVQGRWVILTSQAICQCKTCQNSLNKLDAGFEPSTIDCKENWDNENSNQQFTLSPYLLTKFKGNSISVRTVGGRRYLEELSTDDWNGPDPDHEAEGYQTNGARKIVHVNRLPSKRLLAEAADHHVSTHIGTHIRLNVLSSTDRLFSRARFCGQTKKQEGIVHQWYGRSTIARPTACLQSSVV